jgi:hypothetical protein
MPRPDLCPNCGASTTAHTGSYCHECGEPLVAERGFFDRLRENDTREFDSTGKAIVTPGEADSDVIPDPNARRAFSDDIVAEREPEAAERKPWSEITDEEFMEAVRLAYRSVTTAVGGWRKEWIQSSDVQDALTNPREPSANMRRGLELMVRYGDGTPPSGAITRRLKKLAAEGRLTAVELVSPRARRPAGHGYIVKD